MNKAIENIKDNEKKISLAVTAVFCLAYFFFMLRFYIIDYNVPDFRLYGSFAEQNFKAKDGFSSLFIWIAGISRIMPKFITISCLLLLTGSIFNFVLFYVRCFFVSLKRFSFVLALTFSCGCWYYFYGKIFYDFPFSAFSFSLCLWQVSEIIVKNRNGKEYFKNWLTFFALSGFTLSWKPYNIFMLAGILLCALAKDETRKIVLFQLSNVKKILCAAVAFIFGYIAGNFNLLISPKATIKGIMAYKASFPFREFLYSKHRIIWDHVNDLPFCFSIFSITVILLLFVLVPLVSNRKRYAAVFAIMFVFLRIFIKRFSPGYAWHGLTFGVFLLVLSLFVFSERRGFSKISKVLSVLALAIQLCVTFGFYIPTQIRWHDTTQKAISVLEKENSAILSDIESIVKDFNGKTFYIDEPVKRYKPVATSGIRIRKMGLRHPYIIFDEISYKSPLDFENSYDWERIMNMENFDSPGFKESTKYLVYVVPNSFKTLCDIADLYRYDELPLVKSLVRENYSIYVYDNQFSEEIDIDAFFDESDDVDYPVIAE